MGKPPLACPTHGNEWMEHDRCAAPVRRPTFPLRGNGGCVSRDMAMTPCTTPPYLKRVGDRINERDRRLHGRHPALQVLERFSWPRLLNSRHLHRRSPTAGVSLRPCEISRAGGEVVELTPFRFLTEEITTKAIYRQHLGSLQKIHRSGGAEHGQEHPDPADSFAARLQSRPCVRNLKQPRRSGRGFAEHHSQADLGRAQAPAN